MTTMQLRDVLGRVAAVLLAVGALAGTVLLAAQVPERPWLAVAVAAVVLVGTVALVQPVTLPLLAFPLAVVVQRVSFGEVDLTVSDCMLALSFWPAVLLAPRPFSPAMRRMLWLNLIYQTVTVLTLVANPRLTNTVEWVHAWLLVSGALIIGWAVGASGKARLGASLFLFACLTLAIPALIEGGLQWLRGDFSELYPSYPWPMHKNFIGTLLGFAAVVVFARPGWLGWSRLQSMSFFWIFVVVIGMSQSRQAMLALMAAMLVISLRRSPERRGATLVLVGMIPAMAVVVTLVRDQVQSGNLHNSVFQRLDWYEDAFRAWQAEPLLGYGLRFWREDGAPFQFQPPNVILEVATSTGLIGLIGFAVMVTAMLVTLWRVDPRYGILAFALVLSRLVQAQLDLFWISITVSVPFLIAGVCLGVQARDAGQRPPATTPAVRQVTGVSS